MFSFVLRVHISRRPAFFLNPPFYHSLAPRLFAIHNSLSIHQIPFDGLKMNTQSSQFFQFFSVPQRLIESAKNENADHIIQSIEEAVERQYHRDRLHVKEELQRRPLNDPIPIDQKSRMLLSKRRCNQASTTAGRAKQKRTVLCYQSALRSQINEKSQLALVCINLNATVSHMLAKIYSLESANTNLNATVTQMHAEICSLKITNANLIDTMSQMSEQMRKEDESICNRTGVTPVLNNHHNPPNTSSPIATSKGTSFEMFACFPGHFDDYAPMPSTPDSDVMEWDETKLEFIPSHQNAPTSLRDQLQDQLQADQADSEQHNLAA